LVTFPISALTQVFLSFQIPTVLYYDQYQKVVGWGPDIADALAPTGYPKPGVQKVEWFKLQLMLSGNTYIDPINLPPLPPGKSEIDVAADYLFKLRQAMRAALQKTLGEVFNREERNIRYYLTVPAIWNDAGKAATRAAAIQAGFLRDENDNRLTLISEPEAAALFCSKTGLLNLKVHDAVLIVDCGGGTVDLIAYEVEDENPFTVAECTAGSGDSCGSTALNRNFSNILRTKIRKMKLPDGSKTAGRVYAKCIMDFENRIKADFRNNGQKWAVDVGIEAEFPEAGIEEGYMTFTNEEILQCFEPVVNRILELVRNQIIAIQAQNRTLQNILVVGGFGASEYLFQQIKLHVPPQFQSKVVRPMDSVAAIVKGAVTAGITERVITHRVARRHYLMATLQPFKEGYHPEAYRVPSLEGKDRCKFTRQIFVQKGQKVKIGEPVKVSFFRQVAPGATLMYEDILYACDDDVCPEYTKDPSMCFCPLFSPQRDCMLTRISNRDQGGRYSHVRLVAQEPRKGLRAYGHAAGNLLPRLLRHLPYSGRLRVQRRARLPRRGYGSLPGTVQIKGRCCCCRGRINTDRAWRLHVGLFQGCFSCYFLRFFVTFFGIFLPLPQVIPLFSMT
jgi:hypothetical protein